jgi:hypothetical protein
MLEQIDAITNEVLEPITFVQAYPLYITQSKHPKQDCLFEEEYFHAKATDCATRHVARHFRVVCTVLCVETDLH